MKNEKTTPITNEKAAVADEALKEVSGGMAHVEFGSFGATFQVGESRVRVKNGKSCPSCGCTIGKIPMALGSSGGVKCENCGKLILESYTSEDIEII